jgi:hypothetical protein
MRGGFYLTGGCLCEDEEDLMRLHTFYHSIQNEATSDPIEGTQAENCRKTPSCYCCSDIPLLSVYASYATVALPAQTDSSEIARQR